MLERVYTASLDLVLLVLPLLVMTTHRGQHRTACNVSAGTAATGHDDHLRTHLVQASAERTVMLETVTETATNATRLEDREATRNILASTPTRTEMSAAS